MKINDLDKKMPLHTTKHAILRIEEKIKPNSTKRANVKRSTISKFFVKDSFAKKGSSKKRFKELKDENSMELKLRASVNKSRVYRKSKSPKERRMIGNKSA